MSFPINSMVDLSIAMLVYQRVVNLYASGSKAWYPIGMLALSHSSLDVDSSQNCWSDSHKKKNFLVMKSLSLLLHHDDVYQCSHY